MSLRGSPFGMNRHRAVVNTAVLAVFNGKGDQRVCRVNSALALDVALMYFNRAVYDGALGIKVREFPGNLFGGQALGDEWQQFLFPGCETGLQLAFINRSLQLRREVRKATRYRLDGPDNLGRRGVLVQECADASVVGPQQELITHLRGNHDKLQIRLLLAQ